MRSFGLRLMLLVATLCTGIGSTVWALGHRGDAVETVYVMPSSVSLPVATSYVVSTSWVQPTAYAVPTYYTTAYWMDPVVLAQPTYTATAYVRRGGLFGRRWVVERPVLATYATTYVPTTYYASAPAYRATSYAVVDPLVVPSAYVAAADCVCPPAVAMAAPAYASPSRGTGAAPSGGGSRSRGVRSEAEDRATMDSNVEPAPNELNPINRGGATGEASPAAPGAAPGNLPESPERARDTSPPPPPAAGAASGVNPGPGAAGTTPGAGNASQPGGSGAVAPGAGANPIRGGTNPGTGNPGAAGSGPGATGSGNNPANTPIPTAPGAPADNTELPAIPPPGAGEVRRDSMRPSTYAMRPVPPEFRNVLMGKVVSGAAGEPEEGVRISVRNADTGAGKSTTTDAIGRFAVRLADGDWAVDVTMPSGRVYQVSRLRVSDGLIVDSLGRRIPTLNITR